MNGASAPMLGTRAGPAAGHNVGMKKSSLLHPARRSAGFTLIEVMVALIVLVLGVLGAAAMTLCRRRFAFYKVI